jgi:ketosteroid isomerase-like protein
MTPDTAPIVGRMIDAFNRGDIDAVLEESSQDFEFDFSNSRGPLSGVYRGHAETRGFLTSFFEPWATLDVNLEEIVELGSDRVLTVSEIRTRGQGSGAEVNATGAMVWTIRDGEVAAAKMYQSKADALEAVSAER